MERVAGVEPASSVWKTGILAVILYPQKFETRNNYIDFQQDFNYSFLKKNETVSSGSSDGTAWHFF